MNLDAEHKITLRRDQTIGVHVAVLGTTGSGKTNTGYVWIEEERRDGGTLTIMDPEGDYHHLKAEFDLLIIGKARRGNPLDIEVLPAKAGRLAEVLVRRGVSVICDLSGFDADDKNAFMLAYLGKLWALYQDEDLPPQRVVIDEVQLFCPQGPQTDAKRLIQDLAARGRKRGLGLLVASQRPQKVDKSLLDETNIRFLHRVQRGRTLAAYEDLLPGSLPKAKEIVPGLDRGQAIFMHGDAAQVITVRQSDTFHPDDRQIAPVGATGIAADLLDELKALLGAQRPVQPGDKPNQVERLEARILALEVENEHLRAENALLSKIQVLATPQLAPSSMDVERIDARQLVAATTQLQPVETPPNGAAPVQVMQAVLPGLPEPTAADAYRSPRSTLRAFNKQQRDFETLLRDLAKLPRFHRELLRFLIEHDDSQFSVSQLARYIGVAPRTITSAPPLDLMRMKLVGRLPARKNFEYLSTAREAIEDKFPDHDPDVLLGRLIKACED